MRTLAAALLLAAAAAAHAAPPLTLDDALALAARRNPDLRLSRADVEVAQADRNAARSVLLPRLDLASSAGRDFVGPTEDVRVVLDPSTGERRVTEGTPAVDTASYALSLQLSQTIFDWQQFRAVDRARWSLRAQRHQHEETALAVSFEVTRLFYEAIRAERTLGVLEETARRSRELVERAEALFSAGRVPRSEIFTARVNLQNDLIAVSAQEARVAQSLSALAQVIGADDAAGLAVVAPAPLDAPGLPSGEPPPLEALLALAREQRPAVAAQGALLEAADAAVSSARAGYLPSLSAQASYRRSGADLAGYEAVLGDPTRAYGAAAQVVLRWNLFEGGLTRAEVQRAQASEERVRAGADRTAQAIAREVADARVSAEAFAREVALASDSLGIAREALALATERFEAGLASQLEVRDASLNLTRSQLSLVQSRIDHAVALANLSRAVGGAL